MSTGTRRARPRFVARGCESEWWIDIEDPGAIAELITPRLFASFLKCFRGADILLVLEDLLHAVVQVSPESRRLDRARMIVVPLLLAMMRETGVALREMNALGVHTRVSDPSLLRPISKLLKVWDGLALPKRLRNELGAHLGDLDLFEKGLEKAIADGQGLRFMEGQGSKRHGSLNHLAIDCLMRGLDVEYDDFLTAIEQTREGHTELPVVLHELWLDVLTTAGVELVDERTG